MANSQQITLSHFAQSPEITGDRFTYSNQKTIKDNAEKICPKFAFVSNVLPVMLLLITGPMTRMISFTEGLNGKQT